MSNFIYPALRPDIADRDVLRGIERARWLRARALRQLGRRGLDAFGRTVVVSRPLARALGTLRRRLSAWQRQRHARHELAALDDRLLRDIGVSRIDIESAVRGLPAAGPSAANQNLRPAANDDARSAA